MSAAPTVLDVIVPARNEADRLPNTLAALRAGLAELGVPCVVTVVDNASDDGTAGLVLAAPAGPVPVRLVRCPTLGKGNAVRTGVRASTATYVGFCDADLATALDSLPEILRLLRDGAGVVIGSRSLAASVVQVRHSVVRRWGAALFRWTVQRVVNSVVDTQCGYKFFDGDLARSIFPQVGCGGFAFDVEVLARVERSGYRIVEVPVNWIDVAGSSFSPVRDGLRSFLDVAGIERRMRREEQLALAGIVRPVEFTPVVVQRVHPLVSGYALEPGLADIRPIPAFGTSEGG